MLLKVLVALFSLMCGVTSAARCFDTVATSSFPHCALLDPSYALHWRLLPQEGAIRFAVTVDGSPDWIGRSQGRPAAD